MNIVIAGSTVQIYGEAVKTYKFLPVDFYKVCFNPKQGFYLSINSELAVKDGKIYGNQSARINKVMRSFDLTNRNLGVILSGPKGNGKSLFARSLSRKCIESNVPVIIVDTYYEGIANFLSSIEQSVCVIFDEFEKNFYDVDEGVGPQEEMLSLFDGIDSGKKLFVITCNEIRDLNEYFVNRPGRFHYHFTVDSPAPEEIVEYMRDNLNDPSEEILDKLSKLSYVADVTYDFLRALAFELNQGYSFEESMQDINMSNIYSTFYDIELTTADGQKFFAYREPIDIYRTRSSIDAYDEEGSAWYLVTYSKDFVLNENGLSLRAVYLRNSKTYKFERAEVISCSFERANKQSTLYAV